MGLTPLFAACQSGQYDAVKLLLANKADVNHAHVKTGRTALMEAGARTNASIVKELLRYGKPEAVIRSCLRLLSIQQPYLMLFISRRCSSVHERRAW